MSKVNSKSKNYKQVISGDDCRRRREAAAVAIRKDKKDEGIAKRRNITIPDESEAIGSSMTADFKQEVASPVKKYNILDIPQLMEELNSGDIERQYLAIKGFRKLLSSESNPPIRQCIDCGAMEAFVHFLQRHDHPKIQFESAWSLTNIASSDETKVVVEYGATPHLVALLTSADADVREQAAWCIGNIAGDSAALRDIVLNAGALMPLIANIAQPASISMLRNCIWSLSNLCRGKPQAPLALISSAIPTLAAILLHNTDQACLVDATWALSYISDGDNDRIKSVVAAGVVPQLVQMLLSGKSQLVVPALRTLGNIVTGSDDVTQAVLEANLFLAIPALLENSKKNIRKETCWLLSNIAAGTPGQINQLMAEVEILPRVLDNLSYSREWDVRKEACWVVCNILTEAKHNPAHIDTLVGFGALKHLCDMLSCSEVHMVMLCLSAIETILSADVDSRYRDVVEELDGVSKIEDLQNHQKEEVYKKACEIIEKYFGGEEVDDAENLAPAAQGNVFAFGSTTSAVAQKGFSFGAPTGPFALSQNVPNQQLQQPQQFSFGPAVTTSF